MQDRKQTVQTYLQAIANKAKSQPKYRFRNLYGMLNEDMLQDSWRFIRKDAAFGVDRVSAQEYEQDLGDNIRQLVERLKGKRYRAKLVRRQYIPKGNGKLRPLGIKMPNGFTVCWESAWGSLGWNYLKRKPGLFPLVKTYRQVKPASTF